MKGFLEYIPGNSVFHRMNPLTKLIMSLVLCAVCFVSANHFFVAAMIALNLIIAFTAGIQGMALGLLKGLAKLSVILFVVQVLFIRQGNALFVIPLINLPITDEGVMFSLLLVLRLAAAALPLAIMLSVTPMNDLINAMVSKLHIPYKYAFAVTTAIRFIPVFAQEMSGIMEAQTARGVEFDTKNIFKKLGLMIPMCVPLLVSSVKRIDSNAMSASLRGFDLRSAKSGYKKYSFAGADAMAVVICLVTAFSSVVL